MNIKDVRPGDTILEPGGGRTDVRKIVVGPPGCPNKVHVNDKDCYEGFSDVRIATN